MKIPLPLPQRPRDPPASPLPPAYSPARPTYPPRHRPAAPTSRPTPTPFFTTTYSPGPRVPLVPEVGDRQVVPLVSGRITLQSGKWGLNRVNFPKTLASTENELAPMLENR